MSCSCDSNIKAPHSESEHAQPQTNNPQAQLTTHLSHKCRWCALRAAQQQTRTHLANTVHTCDLANTQACRGEHICSYNHIYGAWVRRSHAQRSEKSSIHTGYSSRAPARAPSPLLSQVSELSEFPHPGSRFPHCRHSPHHVPHRSHSLSLSIPSTLVGREHMRPPPHRFKSNL